MSDLASQKALCALCGEVETDQSEGDTGLCGRCHERCESLFQEEMKRMELIRTIRGVDVELYDIKHPYSSIDYHHCGQVVLIKAGQGFEAKICLRSEALDWTEQLSETESGFVSPDTRMDALIGNVTLLIESWGGGPHYMDIFYVDRVFSAEGEI